MDRMAGPVRFAEDLARCHVLVDYAGVTAAGAFLDETLEDLRWFVDISVWGFVHG